MSTPTYEVTAVRTSGQTDVYTARAFYSHMASYSAEESRDEHIARLRQDRTVTAIYVETVGANNRTAVPLNRPLHQAFEAMHLS